MMKTILMCIVCLCAFSLARGQQGDTEEKHSFAIVPSDQGLLVIVNQPESPLEFVNPKLLADTRSRPWSPDFTLRNRGTKPIRAYTVAVIGLSEWGWKAQDSDHYVMPGQVAPPLGKGEEGELVPLTEELRDKLKLRGPMKGIMALTIVRVEYGDGTVFEDKGYEAQREYFEKLYLSKLAS
jgi:hypothetical protein